MLMIYKQRVIMMQKNQAQVKELAEQVKDFFDEKSKICKNLFSQKNSYESFIIALSALDGLSAIWNILSSTKEKRNKQRYIKFLLEIDTNETQKLSKVCTPFLIYCLKKQNLEADFSTELENKYLSYCQDSNGDWGKDGHPMRRRSHTPSDDPTIEETRNIYNSCNTNNSDQPRIKSIDETLLDFTYGALIYKIYRCSFIHAFRRSQYNQVTFFEGKNITVKHYIEPPQLDVGIELLIDYIKKGADLVYGLVIEQSVDDIPYDITDQIKIQTK